jgi:hypothetical protein
MTTAAMVKPNFAEAQDLARLREANGVRMIAAGSIGAIRTARGRPAGLQRAG